MADVLASARIYTDARPDGPAIPLGTSIGEADLTAPAPNLEPISEVIEPGRALALADFTPPALGAGERLIRFAYKLGLPTSTIAEPFRKPEAPRLIATVVNPLPGSRMAGTALRAGHFSVHGVKAPIATIDFAGAARMSAPLERTVHSFGWLADLEASAPREQAAPVAERIMAAWLNANPKPPGKPGKGPAWSLANAGSRVLNWLVHAPLILSSEDKAERTRNLNAIADTARWLDKNVSRAEDSLGEVSGWCGIVAWVPFSLSPCGSGQG